MKRRVVVPRSMRALTAALLVVLVLPLVLPFAAAKVEAPTATIGDFWEMRSVSTIPDGGGTSTGLTRDSVVAFESLTIEGQTYEAVRTEIFSNTTTSGGAVDTSSSSHTTSWTRRSDGAALKTTTRFTYSTLPGLPASEVTSETIYLQPCRHLPFPIEVGDEWDVSCPTRTTTSSSFPGQPPTESNVNESYTVRALREERVTVPAGAFDAIVLAWTATTEGSNTTYYQWYAAAACTYIRSASDAEGTELTSELVSYRCQSPGASTPSTGTPSTPASGTTPATPATPAGTPSTSPGATPASGATPAGGTTPTTGATPAGNSSSSGSDAPGLPVIAILVALGAAAVALRRR